MTTLCLGAVLSSASAFGQTVISNVTYPSGQTTVTAPNTIYASPNVTVPSGASVSYAAGGTITLDPGFHAAAGSTFVAYLPLSAPGGFQSSLTGSTLATLSWTASSGSWAVTGYQIYRNGTLIAVLGASYLSYTDQGLTPGTAYTYTVVAVDSNGNSTSSTALSVTTLAGLEVFTPVP